jgi:hypothetical protein
LTNIDRYRAWLFSMGTTLTGAIAWSGWMPAISLAILMPIAVSLQRNRRAAFLTAFGYYAGASWPLMTGAKAFFGANATWLESALLWLTSSFLLALPFGVLWTNNIRKRPIWIILALIAVAVPPIGLIGWASPLTSAGVLFPGTAWLSLAATFFVCSFACVFPRLVGTTASVLLLIAHATYCQPPPPASWQAINTKFGSGFSVSDPVRELEIAETIQRVIRDSDSTVLIFPEMVITRWNSAAEAFWEPMLTYLRKTNKTVLLGAGLSVPGQGKSFRNAVLILGSHPGTPCIQRIPVPLAMWKPHKPTDGVPLRLHGPGTTMVAGKRTAILICYEQLLIWPMLDSAIENPIILIGITNDYWATGTRIPAIQKACLDAWARLFQLPVLTAVNL